MKKLCYVATIPAAVHVFLSEHIQSASERYEVVVVCNSVDIELLRDLNARIVRLPIRRKPSFLRDLQALFMLFMLFRRERFDIVHSIMPKTGMLGMCAAWLARVPVRIHSFTGQVWATATGVKRIALKGFDKLIVFFVTAVLVDGRSQQNFLVSEGILKAGEGQMIGAGSICGVNPERFYPRPDIRARIRGELDIAINAKLILFVGRLTRDKGVLDLAAAFNEIASNDPDAALLLLGAEEDVNFTQIQEICGQAKERLYYMPFTTTPEHYMAAADIFCLPSYREGFSMVTIEAAACGLPAVGSRIYGVSDAINENETGFLFPAGDVQELIVMLSKLLLDSELREKMGRAARLRVLEDFRSEHIVDELMSFYEALSKPTTG